MHYDYLIVGAGLYGAVFAERMTAAGKKCLVIEKRGHVAGNAYTEDVCGITVHKYGAHIFHTSNKTVWDYVNKFTVFNNFINSPIASYKNEIYNLPFNMNTFAKLWGISSPSEAKAIIDNQRRQSGISEPKNLEEQAIFLAGYDIYEKFIKGYTEKQWGTGCDKLPAFIIKRVPLRFTYDNNYFNDRYQGIPEDGYTVLTERLLTGADVMLDTDYYAFAINNPSIARKTIFTSPIDEFFGYCCGELEYRSLRFETNILETDNYQGNAVVNYTERTIPYTRVIEHKHFKPNAYRVDKTIVTFEYPQSWTRRLDAYYPLNNDHNQAIYNKYVNLAKNKHDVLFGGRLGKYRYYNMDEVIADAFIDADYELQKDKNHG
jgi:UDP-galactopyranose mutase